MCGNIKDVLIDYIIQLVIFGGDDVAIDRKRSIIEAATKSFSAFGYKATTMDQVAKLANVEKERFILFQK